MVTREQARPSRRLALSGGLSCSPLKSPRCKNLAHPRTPALSRSVSMSPLPEALFQKTPPRHARYFQLKSIKTPLFFLKGFG